MNTYQYNRRNIRKPRIENSKEIRMISANSLQEVTPIRNQRDFRKEF